MTDFLSDISQAIDSATAPEGLSQGQAGPLAIALRLFGPLEPSLSLVADFSGQILTVHQRSYDASIEWASPIATRLIKPLATADFVITSFDPGDGVIRPLVGARLCGHDGKEMLLAAVVRHPPRRAAGLGALAKDLSAGAALACSVIRALDELLDSTARTQHLRAEIQALHLAHAEIVSANLRERERAEEQIRQAKEKYEDLIKNIPDLVYSALPDQTGTRIFISQRWTDWTGYCSEHCYRNPQAWSQSIHAEDRDRTLKAFIEACERKEEYDYEYRIVHKDTGQVRYIREHGIPIPDEKGEILRIDGIATDITERKRLEHEQKKRMQIEQERNHLRDAVCAFERILGVVGHELRTPIGGVRAMTEFLLTKDARETAEFDTFLRSIRDEMIKMGGVVNDLVEVARLNSGAAKWNWSKVRLAEACNAAMDSIRHLIDPAKVQFILEVKPGDLMMNGDVDAVRRLVLNLLNNADKHTSKGWICVRAIGKSIDNYSWVELQVRDTGEGMPPEIAERLGVAFALNSGVVGEQHVRGSGLGLAICKGIVAAHGGTISFETAKGKGTTVTVLLRADLPEPMNSGNAAEITCGVQQ